MISRNFTLLLFSFIVFGIFSCKNTPPNSTKQYTLWKNEFKGNKYVLEDELAGIIPFTLKENSKPFGLPVTPRVFWYKTGQKFFNLEKQENILKENKDILELNLVNNELSARKIQKIERRIERLNENINSGVSWFWRNIGEKQAQVSIPRVEDTNQKIKKFLFDIGYRDAEVNFQIDTLRNSHKIIITYNITENEPYKIDSVIYVITDVKIDSIVNAHADKQFAKAGNLFDLRLVEQEKTRLDQLLKNNGYYNFNAKYILHGATNIEESEKLFKERKSGILRFELLNPEGQEKHEQFYLNEVVFKAFDPNNSKKIIKPDTLFYNEVKYIRVDKSVPIGIVSTRILTKPNELFDLSKILETQRQLGMFNQFAFASSQLKTTKPQELQLEYFAPLLEKYTFGVSPGVNNIYNDGSTFFGFGVPVTLTARNKLNKLETFQAAVRASYEGQPSPFNNEQQPIRGSLEMGVNFSLTLPNIWPINKTFSNINLKNPRTIFGLGFNYSEPFWGKRLNFKLNTNYSLQVNKFAFIYVSLLDANLINTTYFNNESGRTFYNALLEFQKEGNNLKVTFDPQFVSSINTNFVYNDQNPSKPYANSKFFRLFLESGGTTLNFLQNSERINFIEKLFPLKKDDNIADTVRAYFRFLKFNADYRKTINITQKSSYAYRINIGITNPYGANRSLPFDKNFFIGGSNSIRAWAPRTLGAGSSPRDITTAGNTIPQPGDILLESSIEYRKKVFRFAGEIQLATFIDAGNIWKWYNINTPSKVNQANFELNRFYKEIAVGTGFGVRWDLSYFLFRFDWGIKVIDPSRPLGSRFVLDEFSLRRNMPYGLNWNFGIGYPF